MISFDRLKPAFIKSPDLNNQQSICSVPEPVENHKAGHTLESHTTTKSARRVKFVDYSDNYFYSYTIRGSSIDFGRFLRK